jgi:hypothetical protein
VFRGLAREQADCTEAQRSKYYSKISGPLIDRIDIQVEVPEVKFSDIVSRVESESSGAIKERVCRARRAQLERFRGIKIYANAHRGKVRKAAVSPLTLRMSEEEFKPVPSKGWAAMIRKVYELDPMVCPKCGGTMKVVAFITDYTAVDRIIRHLKLRFIAEKPPPSPVFTEVALMAAEENVDYF